MCSQKNRHRYPVKKNKKERDLNHCSCVKLVWYNAYTAFHGLFKDKNVGMANRVVLCSSYHAVDPALREKVIDYCKNPVLSGNQTFSQSWHTQKRQGIFTVVHSAKTNSWPKAETKQGGPGWHLSWHEPPVLTVSADCPLTSETLAKGLHGSVSSCWWGWVLKQEKLI